MLVNEPAFSMCVAAGSRNTSVSMSSVRSSPVSISAPFFQNVAVSISWRSRTTSHFSAARPWRCCLEFVVPTAGFSPSTK